MSLESLNHQDAFYDTRIASAAITDWLRQKTQAEDSSDTDDNSSEIDEANINAAEVLDDQATA